MGIFGESSSRSNPSRFLFFRTCKLRVIRKVDISLGTWKVTELINPKLMGIFGESSSRSNPPRFLFFRTYKLRVISRLMYHWGLGKSPNPSTSIQQPPPLFSPPHLDQILINLYFSVHINYALQASWCIIGYWGLGELSNPFNPHQTHPQKN